METRSFILVLAFMSLAACDKAEQQATSRPGVAETPISTESLPDYEAQGVISSLEDQVLTLDHDGSAAAGLKAGRDRFTVYADVLAEAPITPGARVKFQFKRTPRGLEISGLEGRE
jgi:hypothetical protein